MTPCGHRRALARRLVEPTRSSLSHIEEPGSKVILGSRLQENGVTRMEEAWREMVSME
jgi:hypothetical protein